MKLNFFAKVGLWLVAALLIGVLFFSFILEWKIIQPGYTGIRINRMVDKGITHENIVTGFTFYNPVQTAIIVYPTFVQRVIWTRDVAEGSPTNEELTFNTKDSVPVALDVALAYMLDAQRVPEFYTKFRADNISSFTHGYLRDTARNVVVAIGSEYAFDDINGVKKEEFLQKISVEMNKLLSPLGVSIQQFGLVGSLRPPAALMDAVNAKTKAIQDSIRTENEVRSAQAEAKKRVAIAEGEAAANRALASSLDDRLLAWERLKLQSEATRKWNGVLPGFVSGDSANTLFNVPMQPTNMHK